MGRLGAPGKQIKMVILTLGSIERPDPGLQISFPPEVTVLAHLHLASATISHTGGKGNCRTMIVLVKRRKEVCWKFKVHSQTSFG